MEMLDIFDKDHNYLGTCEKKAYTADEETVLLYSEKNPAEFYNSVECISYNKRILARITDNIIIENLHFKNSGVHALAGRGKNVTIRNCVIENIGGCVWDKDLKVRFGNGIEFWVYGENVLIENWHIGRTDLLMPRKLCFSLPDPWQIW